MATEAGECDLASGGHNYEPRPPVKLAGGFTA
jgi:hypothetical protein